MILTSKRAEFTQLLEHRYANRPCPRCGGKPSLGISPRPEWASTIFFLRCHREMRTIRVTDKGFVVTGKGELLQRIIKALDFRPRSKLDHICAKQALRRRRR